MFKDHLKNKVLRNDNNDLVLHHKFVATKPVYLVAEPEGRDRRNLQATPTTQEQVIEVKTLIEPYPSEVCYNGGQLAKQT
jgi:hypothetical protein